jgi:hypothetical protein
MPDRSLRRAALLGVVCAALLAGCATTVNGTGRLADGVSVPPSATDAPTDTAAPSGSPSSFPPDQPTRQSLSCSGDKIISPSGAPFCFAVPAGFVDVSKSVTVDTRVGNERFRSAVAVGGRDRDLVILTTYELRIDADPIPDDTLETELSSVLAQLTKQGFSFDSAVAKRTTVDGARTFGYHAREPRDKLQADLYFAFRGRNEFEINCQWRDAPGDVQRGCRSVLSSMQLKTET